VFGYARNSTHSTNVTVDGQTFSNWGIFSPDNFSTDRLTASWTQDLGETSVTLTPRNHDYRYIGDLWISSDLSANIKPVATGHDNVQENGIGFVPPNFRQSGIAICYFRNDKPFFFETITGKNTLNLFVVHDKNLKWHINSFDDLIKHR